MMFQNFNNVFKDFLNQNLAHDFECCVDFFQIRIWLQLYINPYKNVFK